jgi:hypothetical protein
MAESEHKPEALLNQVHDPAMTALVEAVLHDFNRFRLEGHGALAILPAERQLWKRHTLTWLQDNMERGIAVAIEAYPDESGTGDIVQVSVAPWRATDARAPEYLSGPPLDATALRQAVERAYQWTFEPPPPGRRERRLRSL